MNSKIKKPKEKLVQTLCIHPSPVPCSIPLLERHELAQYDGNENKVSPAEYNPKYDQIKPRNPASLFSKSKYQRTEKLLGYENIGPGTYSIEGIAPSAFKKTIHITERFKEKKEKSPGPGDYEPNISLVKPNPPKCFVSNLDRTFNIAKNIVQENPIQKKKKTEEKVHPNAVFASGSERDCNKIMSFSPVGPGKYEVYDEKKEGFSFCEQPRFKIPENESPVGPGAYDPIDLIKSKSPVQFRTRRFQHQSDLFVHSTGEKLLPGPGDYDLTMVWPNKRKGIAFDLTSGRNLDKKHEHSPDPGQYHMEYNYSGGHRIGAQDRFKPGFGNYIQNNGSSEFVGPGSYRHKASMVKRTHNISWI